MTAIFEKLKSARFRVPSVNECLHRSYKGMHSAYFLFVWLEGHGLYAVSGGILLGLSVADFFLHFEGDT